MPAPVLDPQQQRVVEHRSGPLLVLGGPGTGKTTVLVELVAARVRAGLDPGHVLLLASSPRSAAALRDRLAQRIGGVLREPPARTPHSYAFGLLRRQAVRAGLPTPRLLSGAEQQLVITDLLAGDPTRWPVEVRPALRTRAFANQLRDLLLRAVERGVDPADLAELGRRYDRPLWVAAAAFAHEYAGVTALAHPGAYDPAELVRAAVDLLREQAAVLAAEQSLRRLVVVDEYSEADPALVDLLRLLAGGGRDLVVSGDPDTSVFGFRGAEPALLARFPTDFPRADGSAAPGVLLTVNHRLGPQLLDVAARVSARLGGAGPQRRMSSAVPAGNGGPGTAVRVLASSMDEVTQVAAHLRRRHLLAGVPWSQMAVLVRAAGDLAPMRRGLARHGVPVAQRAEEVALAQQAPVRALLDLLAVLVGRDAPTPERVDDLLCGPYGGLDPVRLAAVRRSLLEEERRAGGTRRADELVVAAVLGDGAVPPRARAVLGLRAVLAAGRSAAGVGSVEDVLWALWEAAGVAPGWREAALAGGEDGTAADRDLDAVLALFDAAGQFTDRLPGAGPAAFLDHVRAQQVPAAAGSAPGRDPQAVTVLTVHAAKDREWDTVAVCRVLEESWPDLRRRDTLLGIVDLLELRSTGRVAGPAEQVSALLAAERRLFYVAVTRARRDLLVTAVDDGEVRPSRLLEDLCPADRPEPSVGLPDRVLSLPRLVGELRAAVCDPAASEADRAEAARLLAVLARERVPGAHPDQWYGLPAVSDPRPLSERGQPLTLSPSQVEKYLRCPLRWMLQRAGGDTGGAVRAAIGSLVHDLAFEAAAQSLSAEEVWASYERRWADLDTGQGWLARRERRRVDAMVQRLLGWLADETRDLVGAEVDMRVQVGDVVVAGRVDRLERGPDGSLVVVDFKTGASTPTRAEVAEHPQLGVYQWALGAGGAEPVVGPDVVPGGGRLVHLGLRRGERAKEQDQPALGQADDPQWPRALVEQVRAGASRPAFAALVGSWCGGCPVRTSCPAQPEGGRVTS
jgi:superfamily I DNA/RNA helicase/RecB family exonuclease